MEWKTGIHGSAGFAYSGNSRLSGLLLLEWDCHDLNLEELASIPEEVISGGRLTVITGTANIRLNLVQRGSALPYVLAGAGVYRTSSWTVVRFPISGSQKRSTYSETAVAVQLGIGLSFPISSWFGLFVDGRYLVGLTKRQSIRSIPIRLGVRL